MLGFVRGSAGPSWFLSAVGLGALCLVTANAWGGESQTHADGASEKKEVRPVLSRWIDLQAGLLGIRYRFIENSHNTTTNNQGQHKEQFRGRFLFDPKGNFTLNANLSSGGGFIGTWNNGGWGTGDFTSNLYLRHLFFSGKLVNGVEAQYGGFAIERGSNTEITSFDNDNYMMGQRLLIGRPDKLFFDQIGVTYGYVGDVSVPDLRKRFHRLKKSNYHQFLVSKKAGKRLTFSVDYTFLNGTDTLREGVAFTLAKNRVLDSVVFENYQRLDGDSIYGYAVHGRKALHKLLRVTGGFSDIDPFYGVLNGDRYSRGSRLFGSADVSLLPDLALEVFFQRAMNIDFAIGNKTRLDIVLTYNLVPGLKRTGLF